MCIVALRTNMCMAVFSTVKTPKLEYSTIISSTAKHSLALLRLHVSVTVLENQFLYLPAYV